MRCSIFQPPGLSRGGKTKAHKVVRAVSRAQRAARPRRWRRNRLRYTKNRSNRFFWGAAAVGSCCGLSVIETSRLPINPVLFPFASRETEAQKTLPAASCGQRGRGHG
ncbi:unnamed protein product, partial [Ectocarpus sp. 12 AP-2014]